MNSLTNYLIILPFFAICFLVANLHEGQAQTNNKAFRHFTPQEGFPSLAFRLEQGDKGKIWITGPSGLISFDGYDTHVFTPDPSDSTSVPEGILREILNDNNGHLWLHGLNGISIYNYETAKFREVSIPDSLPPYGFGNGIIQSSDNLIWVGASNGVYGFSIPTSETSQPKVSYFEIVGLEGNAKRVTDLIEGPDGQIWISTTEGLYLLDPGSGVATKAGPFNQIPDGIDFSFRSYMVMDGDKTVWISLDGGLLRFAEGEKEPEFLSTLGEENFSLEGIQMNFLSLMKDGTIWIGTETNGALQFHPSTHKLTQYTGDAGSGENISENNVYGILEDMDGNIWFGHLGSGLSMMYEKAWNYTFNKITETDDPTAGSNVIRDLEPDANDNIWAATTNGLTFIPSDGSSNKLFLPDSMISASGNFRWFSAILQTGEDALFLIEQTNEDGNRLHRFDKKELRFTGVLSIDSLAFLGSFTSDGTNLYWTLRGESKLMMLNPEDLSTTSIDLPLAFPEVINNADATLYVNPLVSKSGDLYLQYNYEFQNERSFSERIYFKLDPGLQTFSEVPLRSPESERSLKMSFTTIASQQQDGVFWTRTNAGLLKEDVIAGTSSLIISESAAKEYIFGSILEDRQGNIWYSDYGSIISKIDPNTQREQSFLMDKNRKPSVIEVIVQLPGGDIIVGGTGGYIQFDPAEIREEQNIQKLFIDEFRTGATRYSHLNPEEDYEVEHEDNNLSFSFTGINFRSGDTRYRYRLLGYEDEWVDLGSQRSIFFANLPFGSYRFQVQATTVRSSFTDDSITAEVQFTILPPWWRTTFAYALYILFFGGFVFGIDRIQRKRVIQKERERANAKELEQAKEIEKAYQNLEVAHKDLEQAHSNLKSAQDQLVQQEKLASLGQLTAGIAHEIKNPLNFVNNFSGVSIELLEEAFDEIAKLEKSEISDEISAILTDVKANLSKIYEHGTRADGIVQSMLLHSRGGDGKMEPTPLNPIIKEYVNLAFHGMRASKEPINVDIDLQLDENVGEVPLVAEDFSRVILNVCNNAFDAVSGKLKVESGKLGAYSPKLSVRTKSTDGNILIEIEDNGPGIPDDIKDKILQPFFTTKKGKQGTGLGLSITNDIIKAHGGELKVETKEGAGSTFIIQLPLASGEL